MEVRFEAGDALWLLINSNRIVKHISVMNEHDTSTSYYIGLTRRNDIRCLVHVSCKVKCLWNNFLKGMYKHKDPESIVHLTISPQEFVDNFMFYDTKEPCGIKVPVDTP
jgi:hypothetical protein